MAEETEKPKLSEKAMLYIGLFFLLLFIIIGIVIYRSGKKSGDTTVNLSNPITDKPNDPNNQGSEASSSDLNSMAEAVHQDMDGANVFGHSTTLWQNVLTLSDTDFVNLYNKFNSKYQLASGQTFTSWLKSESNFWTFSMSWTELKNAVLQKLSKLNLQ